jgi:isopentenyl-diphosphate delta-isomerase
MHEQRKEDHIRINLEKDVNFRRLTTGLEHYHFLHQALPELDMAQVDPSISLFGKTLKAPLLISSMTVAKHLRHPCSSRR